MIRIIHSETSERRFSVFKDTETFVKLFSFLSKNLHLGDKRIKILFTEGEQKSNGYLISTKYSHEMRIKVVGDFNINTFYEMIETIIHEFIHIDQIETKKLVKIDNMLYKWDGSCHHLNEIEYMKRPWEIDAFSKQREMTLNFFNEYYEAKQ